MDKSIDLLNLTPQERALEKILKHGLRYCGKTNTLPILRDLTLVEVKALGSLQDIAQSQGRLRFLAESPKIEN